MAFKGHIPEDVPEDVFNAPDRAALLDGDELLAYLEQLGIDLDGFDIDGFAHDPMATPQIPEVTRKQHPEGIKA
jgi:hypothetical protein